MNINVYNGVIDRTARQSHKRAAHYHLIQLSHNLYRNSYMQEYRAGLPKLAFCVDPLVKRKIQQIPLMSNNKK